LPCNNKGYARSKQDYGGGGERASTYFIFSTENECPNVYFTDESTSEQLLRILDNKFELDLIRLNITDNGFPLAQKIGRITSTSYTKDTVSSRPVVLKTTSLHNLDLLCANLSEEPTNEPKLRQSKMAEIKELTAIGINFSAHEAHQFLAGKMPDLANPAQKPTRAPHTTGDSRIQSLIDGAIVRNDYTTTFVDPCNRENLHLSGQQQVLQFHANFTRHETYSG
jgi:hypothetical protein